MRSWLRTALVAVLGLGLVTLFLWNANLHDVWREVTRARIELLALAVAVTGLTYLLRAIRWQFLLRPIGHVSTGQRLPDDGDRVRGEHGAAGAGGRSAAALAARAQGRTERHRRRLRRSFSSACSIR